MKKRYIVTLCLFVLFLAAGGLFFGKRASFEDKCAESYGKDYARIAVYHRTPVSFDTVNAYRVGIDARLISDSHSAEGRLWYDAFASFGEASVSRIDSLTPFRAKTLSVSADFFKLHSFKLLSGDVFYGDDNYSDRVLIDERCSFELFGSYDSVGMPLEINSKTWYVAGVFKAEDSDAWRGQFEDYPTLILPCDIESGELYSVYEIVLPSPVGSYGLDVVKGVATDEAVVDVTNRYGFSHLFDNLSDFFTRSYVTQPVSYPWFENTARGRVDVLSLFLLLWCVSGAALVISLSYLYIRRKK